MLNFSKRKRFLPFFLGFLSLSSFFSSRVLAADNFNFSAGPGAGLYQVNQNFYSFTVQARTGGSVDGSYNNVVTISLYNTINPPPQQSDPGVKIISGGVTYTGTAALAFSSGTLSFQMKFETGSDSEQVFLQDSGGTPVTIGDTYPGIFAASIGGAAITVQGFSTLYYLADTNWATLSSTPASYPPNSDLLVPQGSTIINNLDNEGGDVGVTVPPASGAPDTFSGIPPSAASFAVTGVNGGYAAGGQGILASTFFKRANVTDAGAVTFAVILDYDGSLADYDHPRPNQDTVYLFGKSPTGTSYGLVNSGGSIANSAPFQTFMNNGQIIVRSWTAAPITDPVQMRYETFTGTTNNLSSISVPYSSSNVQPVKGTASPSAFLDGAPATLVYTIKNQFSTAVTNVIFQVPANSPVAGNPWNFTSVNGPAGSSPGVTSNPTVGGAPGTITVQFTTPLAANQTVAVTLIGTASDQDGSYPVSMISASNASNGLPAPTDTSTSIIKTFSPPSVPGSFSGSVTSFINSGGGNVALSWGSVTNENAIGYVLTRSPGGAPFGTVTLPSGAIITNAVTLIPSATNLSYNDSNTTNLTTYTYGLRAYNAVAQSGGTTITSTPYVNPGPPTAPQALTGGTTIQLSWTAPASVAGSYPVTAYQIFRGTSSGAENTTPVAAVTSSAGSVTYLDSPLSGGTNYYYYVSAIDNQYSGGPTLGPDNSGPSGEVTGFPFGNPPNSLATTLLLSGAATIQLSWTAPVSNLTAPVSYYVTRGVNGAAGVSFATVNNSGASVTVLDGAVTAGSYYTYSVAGIDASAVTTNPAGPVTGLVGPAAPTGLAQVGGPAAVTLTWPAVPNAAGETVVSYNIYQNGVSIGSVSAGPATLTAIDPSPVQGTNYTYQVSSVDQNAVQGGKSNTVTSALLPLVPQSFAVTVQQTGVSFNVDLNWTAPLSSANVTNYNIRNNAVNNNFGSSVFLAGVPFGFAQPYVDPHALSSAGTTIFYWIRAQDPGGVGPTTLAGLQIPPNPPTGLTTASTAATITLNWTPNLGSDHVSLYSIYRSTNPVSGFVTIGTSVGTSYKDGTGTVGTDYYYKISATNPGGGVGIPGGESLLSASVTAADSPTVPVGLSAVLDPASDNVALTWTSQSAGEANLQSYTLSRTINGGVPVTLQTAAASVTTYADSAITSANAGATVLYYLFATNDTGAAGANSAQEGPVGVQVPPKPPTGITANPSASAVTIGWASRPVTENVSQYTIYRTLLPAGTPTPVGTAVPGTAVSFADSTGLSRGATYVYNVTATNPGGGVGVPGGESAFSAGINSGLAPLAPAGLAVTGIDTSNDISMTWTDVTGADPNATGVTLFVNANSAVTTGAVLVNVSPVNSTAVTDQGIFNGAVTGEIPDTTYYYWLQTKNPFGIGALDGPVSKLTYPAAVSLMPVTLAANGISRILDWNALPADVTSYNLYREQIGGSGFILVQSFPASIAGAPTTVTLPVQPGKTYVYEITGVNPTGEGPYSNPQTFSALPSAPQSVTAVSGISNLVTQVNLAWTDPTAAGEGVTGFTVYRATNNSAIGNFSPAATITSLTYNYSDPTVAGATIYYYIVTADDSSGQETLLSLVNSIAVTAYALPNPPGTPTAVPANGSVTLSWSAGSATTYPVSIYAITKFDGAVTTLLTSPTSPFTDSTVTNGVTYVYSVQTEDNQGHLSAASASVTVIPLAAPGPPTNVKANIGDQEILLTWNVAAAGTLPNGSYQIYRIAPGPVTALLTTVPATNTSYLDAGLTDGQTYSYWMATLDNSGLTTGLDISANSVTVSAVPAAGALNPPSNFTAAAGVAQVVLGWTDSVTVSGGTTVTGYNLFRSTSASFTSPTTLGPYGVTGATQAVTDTGLVNGTTYYYFMIATSPTTVSANSATVFGTPVAPPAAPTSLLGIDGSNKVTLDWAASPAQGSVTISNYFIVQTINGGGPATFTTAGPVTTYIDNSVNNSGQTVVYEVGAVNSNNTPGSLSGAVTDYPYASFPATITSSLAGAATVTLNFNPAASPSWPVTQLDIVRTPELGGTPVTVAASALTSPVTDTTGATGTLYIYDLLEIDSKGHLSGLSNAVTDGPSNPPNAPATLVVSPGSQQVLIDWPASAPVTGSIPVSFYIVTINNNPATVLAPQTWYLDSGLIDPAAVTVSILAVDGSGVTVGNHASTVVGPVTVATNAANLNPPTGLAAKAAGNSIKLTWNLPNDEGKIVTGFNLFRSGTFITTVGSALTALPNPALAPVTTYTDAGLNPNTTYFYVVQAVYQQGATQAASSNSNNASDTTAATAAGVPPVTVGVMAFDANLLKPLTGQVLSIYFVAPKDGPAELDVYNISGNPIRALFATAVADGQVSLTWDGKDRNGRYAASGVYLIEIKAPGLHQVKKVLVVK